MKPQEKSAENSKNFPPIRSRRRHSAGTGISAFLLKRYVIDKSSISQRKVSLIEARIASNSGAREQYERMVSDLA